MANTELVIIAGLAKSKSEAFRLIEQGGITINDVAVTDPRGAGDAEAQALGNRFKVSKGSRNVAVVEIDPVSRGVDIDPVDLLHLEDAIHAMFSV